MSQPHLVLSLPQAWKQSFISGALIPFSGEWYLETKIWVLDVLVATRLVIVSRTCQKTELGNKFFLKEKIHEFIWIFWICFGGQPTVVTDNHSPDIGAH